MADAQDILDAQTDYPAYRKRRKAEIAAHWAQHTAVPPVAETAEVAGGSMVPAVEDPVAPVESSAEAPAPKRKK